MQKFISPVLRKLIKVAILLLVFVVLMHNSKDDKNLGAESLVPFGVSNMERVPSCNDLQVDESVAPESDKAYAYELPAIFIGKLSLGF